jgi:cytochrome c peroxidase
MLNETNKFIPAPPFQAGGRFQSVAVSEFNDAGNPVFDFVFTNDDGSTTLISSPDPGRALITGNAKDFESVNAFKIPSLWGIPRTAPYFHDNSAKTLDDVARHYARFFAAISPIQLTEQDQKDMIAYMKLLR